MASFYSDPSDRAFVRKAMAAPLLSSERESDLVQRWRQAHDQVALDELTNAHVRLVISIANRFKNYGLPQADLVQEGVVGLMTAAGKFDLERDVRFATYAAWWVRSTIQDYILRNWSVVRTGTTTAQKALFFNLRRLRAQIGADSFGQLDDAGRKYVAEELGIDVAEVAATEHRLSGGDLSLNAPAGIEAGDAKEHLDLLRDERPNPEEAMVAKLDAAERAAWLADELAKLKPRDRVVLEGRRLREERDTLGEVGAPLGISRERVRQIEHRALQKLKAAAEQRAQQA